MTDAERLTLPLLLKVEHLSLELGGRRILRDVDCEIRDLPGRGQVVGFLGPSGIGKTQLARRIAGLDEPTSGRVLVTPNQVPVRAGLVGMVMQHYPLFAHRTVFGNLVVAGRSAGLSRAAARDKAESLLRRLGLEEVLVRRHGRLRYPNGLSGGQRQRAAIAQQLMCSDHYLILDEPFSGLDPIRTDECCALIREVAAMDELNTIIVITHELSAAVQVADTLWLMGLEREPITGDRIPGARIRETFNLVDLGLDYQPGIANTQKFSDFVRTVRARFPEML